MIERFFMETQKLEGIARTQSDNLAVLRKGGKIPAVVYGNKVEPMSVAVDAIPFQKTLRKAGESTLVDLSIDKKEPVKVLIHDIQYHPVRGDVVHIDFYQVNMKEKITTHIALEFIGEAPAVEQLSGTLVKNMDELEVECLPGDLVHAIEVDISVLNTFDDAILVKDIALPKGLEGQDDPEATVVFVEAPRSEAELEADLAAPVSEQEAIAQIASVEEKPNEAEDAGEEGK